ncbi:MAG: hypothetical protein C4584_01865 [Armatimonadetes bacterium]|nr:MAG: hypothetical protein C4584_01865 [Armatimonadota bacterium]
MAERRFTRTMTEGEVRVRAAHWRAKLLDLPPQGDKVKKPGSLFDGSNELAFSQDVNLSKDTGDRTNCSLDKVDEELSKLRSSRQFGIPVKVELTDNSTNK